MKNGKPKRTRRDADGLFPDLQQSDAHSASRPDNPFGEETARTSARRERDEASLWKDNLVTLPAAIELPPGYESVSHVRESMERAWRMKWVRESGNEVVAEFPEGWAAIRPASGAVELRDASGVVRAVYGWAGDAEVRLLPRYRVESQENSSSGLGSLLVRDRENGQILERSSTWSAQTGTNHPDWARLSAWLDKQYPLHRDPLRLWTDCEANRS
ncbi:hypothetical protein AYM40_13620 [Paraburkholderia phytofirmans OLGA172]|uniref:Nitroreductase n=1 Tax=Paraburkholderia phytofirmans OLGA172 TaxID=1417228 RepID=A0A160FLJ9_9BURK|nr:hypothetical protein [Paraburkholderia phytofirmans]ANB73282.1 hypothetical protein AYM40_13620 [Paraburkholderia phytofirmans OLGA172]